jgi:hypothetical protein
MPNFIIMRWPEGTDPGTWMPVAQGAGAPSMLLAVKQVDPGPGRYKVTLADEPSQPAGLVLVDDDGVRDVDAFN